MKKIVTHSGAFHVDDIFAVATLVLALGDDVSIDRSRDSSDWAKADYLVDVGAKYSPSEGFFDHHQEQGAGKRENGIPYASFGLVWKEFGLNLSDGDDIVFTRIEEKLVCPVDAVDNGISLYEVKEGSCDPYTIHDFFRLFHPEAGADKKKNAEAFETCVNIAKDILRREIKNTKESVRLERFVEEAYQNSVNKQVIILKQRYPWPRVLETHPEPLFVVYPDFENGTWAVKAVRKEKNSFDSRKPFPETWAGKRDEELQHITGVKDAVFCHTGRFIVIARSEAGAIELTRKAIEY